jgi:hypothetical protein
LEPSHESETSQITKNTDCVLCPKPTCQHNLPSKAKLLYNIPQHLLNTKIRGISSNWSFAMDLIVKKGARGAKDLFEYTKSTFSAAVNGLRDVEWKVYRRFIKDCVAATPKMTTFSLICLLVAICPGLVVTPALTVIGFGPLGPLAGRSPVQTVPLLLF